MRVSRRKSAHVATLIATAVALALLCACSRTPAARSVGSRETSSPVRAVGAAPVGPGVRSLGGGRVEVVGTLQRDESDAWLVIGTVPDGASSGHVIAVIANPASLALGDLSRLDNAYVRVVGTASGTSGGSAEVSVVADTIATVTAR